MLYGTTGTPATGLLGAPIDPPPREERGLYGPKLLIAWGSFLAGGKGLVMGCVGGGWGGSRGKNGDWVRVG